ncbi:MAG: PilN domain-containing protein [Acidobacteria bacterium]|nr:PilN domain-containing protein [Acidobacteriota bacterium]
MIKVNLLHSVTERQGGTVTAVERKVGSPGTRLLMLTLAVGFLLLAVIGWDVISTQMAKTDAERRLAEQKQIAAELEVVMKEQRELEQKIQQIDMRIEAIKTLRANQAGPSAVLDSVRERIAMVPGLYLQAIEQTGNEVVIKGNSPSEDSVVQFGRSLEFSNGLFTNLNIETQRQEMVNQSVVPASGAEAPKVNVVDFTIKTAYTPSKAANANDGVSTAAAEGGQAKPATAPAQVAQN